MRVGVVLAIFMSIFSGCGADSRHEENQNKMVFSLKNVNNIDHGEIYRANLVGISTFGHILIENMQPDTINGVYVVPNLIHFERTSGSIGSGTLYPIESWKKINYIEIGTGNLISFTMHYDSPLLTGEPLTCNSLSPYHLPDEVKIGDFDTTPGFSCSDNTVLSRGSWRAESGGKNLLNLNIFSMTKNNLGNEIEVSITYTINSDGNIVAVNVNGLKDSYTKSGA